LLALGVVILGTLVALRFTGPPAVRAVCLEAGSAESWEGIPAGEQAGVLALLQEAAELDPRLTLLLERPRSPVAGACRVWSLVAHRRGDRLKLVLKDERGTVVEVEDSPLRAIHRAFGRLGFATANLDRLLPEDSAAFWDLARLSGPFTWDQMPLRKKEALALAEQHPDKAAPLYGAAYASLRLLIVDASDQVEALENCDRLFQRALAPLPAYPRALYHYCRFKTDVGAGRESLEIAIRLRAGFPNHPQAYGALAYAARNAGLLDSARVALEARSALVGGRVADPGLGENTYLYLGDLDRFEQSLVSAPGTAPSPIRLFYLGYAKLLRGDRGGALALFRECQSRPGRVIQFEALAQVYELALTQRPEEALAALRRLHTTRTRLRVPDGEFTFKLAEAFAFLEAPSEAVAAAASAFAQGFGCTRWYRKSPFLASLQDLPRWEALLKQLQEREALLAERFPPKAFRRS
jgi:hypothetical protein